MKADHVDSGYRYNDVSVRVRTLDDVLTEDGGAVRRACVDDDQLAGAARLSSTGCCDGYLASGRESLTIQGSQRSAPSRRRGSSGRPQRP